MLRSAVVRAGAKPGVPSAETVRALVSNQSDICIFVVIYALYDIYNGLGFSYRFESI